jgi:hypothetical protein
MKTLFRWQGLVTCGLFLGVLTVCGCQTWVPSSAQTLPSGHYLQHPPQYIPDDPDFPLANELAAQEEAALGAPAGGGAIP